MSDLQVVIFLLTLFFSLGLAILCSVGSNENRIYKIRPPKDLPRVPNPHYVIHPEKPTRPPQGPPPPPPPKPR